MTRHLYRVDGWGVGEVWERAGTIVHHELPSDALDMSKNDAARWEGPLNRVLRERIPDVLAVSHGAAGPAAPDTRQISPKGGARLPARTLPANRSRVCANSVSELCRLVRQHLSGLSTTYDGIPIDLEWATPLHSQFAAAARAIPWGEVVSYGELAALAGRPGAARAAGSFCADNRYSLVIPCHRVVSADGIGGYGSAGVELKRRLLALEGVRL